MEKKQRTTIWMSPEILNQLDAMALKSNCKSRSVFIEEAVRFYNGYLDSKETNTFLPISISSTMQGMIRVSEDRISSLLFKNAVELDMMMNILAATAEIDEETLKKLRRKCIEHVKSTRGKITFDDAYRFQNNKSKLYG